MSWRVRHFLKQVRENKEDDECKKLLAQTKDISNGTVHSTLATTDNQSNTLYDSPKLFVAEKNNLLTSSSDTKESKSPNLECRLSPFDSSKGRYINWATRHTQLIAQSWCCISDIIYFCDKYEYQSLRLSDPNENIKIVSEVKALLSGGKAPFDLCKRFPGNIQKPEDLWICIGRCTSVEYHLKKILGLFRRPVARLVVDKQRVLKQNFHLAVSKLRLDISAHISTVSLYDRNIFEHEFQLRWENTVN